MRKLVWGGEWLMRIGRRTPGFIFVIFWLCWFFLYDLLGSFAVWFLPSWLYAQLVLPIRLLIITGAAFCDFFVWQSLCMACDTDVINGWLCRKIAFFSSVELWIRFKNLWICLINLILSNIINSICQGLASYPKYSAQTDRILIVSLEIRLGNFFSIVHKVSSSAKIFVRLSSARIAKTAKIYRFGFFILFPC